MMISKECIWNSFTQQETNAYMHTLNTTYPNQYMVWEDIDCCKDAPEILNELIQM